MNNQATRLLAGLLVLLCSSAGMAASVTVVASNAAPAVGETFTLTIQSNAGNTFAATMALAFDDTRVAYVSGVVTGLFSPGTFTKNSPTSQNPTVFDLEAAAATAANPGTYNAAILTFQAIAAGAANIVINDDGGTNTGWFDADTAEVIPVDYTQASVMVMAIEPDITVTDDVAPIDDHEVPFGTVTESPDGLNFSTRTVTVTNSGNADLVLDSVAQANPLAAPFSLVLLSDTCSGQTLAPAGSCTVEVEFRPLTTGDFPDSFDIPSSDPDEPSVNVGVSGTGTPLPVPGVVVTDPVAPANDHQVPFGAITQNQTSTRTVTVANEGTANLTVGQIATANPLLAPFGIANDDCSGQVVAPQASCTFEIQFQPAAAGPFSDSLDIPSDDPDTAAVTVSVSGSGSDPAAPESSSGGSALDPGMLLAASLLGFGVARRRRLR